MFSEGIIHEIDVSLTRSSPPAKESSLVRWMIDSWIDVRLRFRAEMDY